MHPPGTCRELKKKRQSADSESMHRRSQIQSTRKVRIHVLETKSEDSAPAPMNDQRNARPLPAKTGKSERARSKLSTLNHVTSRLEQFAREHELTVDITEDPAPIGEDDLVSWICFEDAYISDPLHDCFLVDVLGSKEAVERALEESKIENPLLLVLLEYHINRLIDRLGFDLPNFERGENAAWPDPGSSDWGAILHRTGLRYLSGCDAGKWLLFSSCDRVAVAMALALARVPMDPQAGADDDDWVQKCFR
jgi:hypothetical protein